MVAVADAGATSSPSGDGPGNSLGGTGTGWSGFAGSSLGAAASRGLASHAGGEASPPPRKTRTYPATRGEKTADGRPKPDERTVADLVQRGWFMSEEAAVALLTRRKTNVSRYVFETAESAADWLEATLGPEPVKDGLCPAAKAVKRDPNLLYRDADTLQRRWDALTLSTERGGVGIAFSTEQAREAIRKHPQLLGSSVETYKAGWSMLTDKKVGQGLPHEEARECILRAPAVLMYDIDKVVRRVALLKSLGYEEARAMVLRDPRVLNFKEETVKETAAWWKQSGLDHVKLVTTHPNLLGLCSVEELQAKLDFLRYVVGMSDKDLNNAGALFTRSLDGRLRARYFYALLKRRLARFGRMSTMLSETDTSFLAMMQGLPYRSRASSAAVARYHKLVSSAGFVAWRERQEARLMRGAPRLDR